MSSSVFDLLPLTAPLPPLTGPAFFPPSSAGLDPAQLTTDLQLLVSLPSINLIGALPGGVVEVQIQLAPDLPWTSDPDYVLWDLQGFQIPDPSVFPEGLPLSEGLNTIRVRSVDALGNLSPVASATIQRIALSSLDLGVTAPSGLSLLRGLDYVELQWAANPAPSEPGSAVLGYHVWASVAPGGGDQGYLRVTASPVQAPFETRDQRVELERGLVQYAPAVVGGAPLRQLLVEQDPVTGAVLTSVGDQTYDLEARVGGSEVRVVTIISSVDPLPYFRYRHRRTDTLSQGVLNSDVWSAVPPDQPLYYVLQAVAIQPLGAISAANVGPSALTASPFSAELTGSPLPLSSLVSTDLPLRQRDSIVQDYINAILRVNPEVSAIPGSYVRDIFVEPFASEAERIYFVQDFIERGQSFSTLLRLDDLDNDGLSDPVAASPYKRALRQALGLTQDPPVQALIDDRFDRLAANFNVFRQGALPASGQVLFVSSQEPTADVTFPTGTLVSTGANVSPAQVFQTTAQVVVPFASRASYFNLRTNQYEVSAPIVAVNPGEAGNLSANQIQRLQGGPAGWRAFNPEATSFGRDVESNADLANRASQALSGVDAGTAGGYLATTLGVPGVRRAVVVRSGDPLMMRDWDPVRLKHIGGKVDIYLQGVVERTVREGFALSVQLGLNGLFRVEGSPSGLLFVIDDPRLTPQTPLLALLGGTPLEAARGFGLRNLTTGQTFNVAGAVVLDYNRVRLVPGPGQPVPSVTDVIRGDYRYQSLDAYFPVNQPVRSITSLIRAASGAPLLEGTDWELVRAEDPLLEGGSVRARDFIRFLVPVNGTGSEVVTSERLVLVGQEPEPLANLGVDPVSIRLFNLDRSVEYVGPFAGAATPDFFVNGGGPNTAAAVVRNPAGVILSGQEVLADYQHDENLVLTYTHNALLAEAQRRVEVQSHVTADPLIKEGVEWPVALEAVVVLERGAVQAQVDSAARTALSQLFNNALVGQEVAQSDVVEALEGVTGVFKVLLPLGRMALSDGALIVREPLNSSSTFLASSAQATTYLLQDALEAACPVGGGDPTRPVGVYLNDQPLTLTTSLATLYATPNSALFLGVAGRSIPGFSDDATLTAQGFNTPAAREARRRELTGNRVAVSLTPPATPEQFAFSVTYQAEGDAGSRDLAPNTLTYLTLGSLALTYTQR